MSSKRKALVVYGVGLGVKEELSSLFLALDFEVDAVEVNFVGDQIPSLKLREYEIIAFQGPWVATPDEILYAKILALKLSQMFSILKKGWSNPAEKFPQVLAIGRGALAVMSSDELWGSALIDGVEWRREFARSGPWVSLDWKSNNPALKAEKGVRVKIGNSQESDFIIEQALAFGEKVLLSVSKEAGEPKKKKVKQKEFANPLALLQGRAFPRIQGTESGPINPWIKSGDVELGWKSFQKKLCFCLVDILAFSDRTQSQNFGYSDLSQVPTRLQVLDHLLRDG
jgi:hypothetical protein